jgi:hypothetical protein
MYSLAIKNGNFVKLTGANFLNVYMVLGECPCVAADANYNTNPSYEYFHLLIRADNICR